MPWFLMKTNPTVVKAEWSSCTAAQLERSLQQDSTSLKSTTGIESSVAIDSLFAVILAVDFFYTLQPHCWSDWLIAAGIYTVSYNKWGKRMHTPHTWKGSYAAFHCHKQVNHALGNKPEMLLKMHKECIINFDHISALPLLICCLPHCEYCFIACVYNPFKLTWNIATQWPRNDSLFRLWAGT